VWEKRVQEWQESGLSAAEYALKIGANVNTLQNWHYKLQSRSTRSERTAAAEAGAVEFVEVATAAASVEYEPIEVVLAGGARLRVPSRFDEKALRKLVALLERR